MYLAATCTFSCGLTVTMIANSFNDVIFSIKIFNIQNTDTEIKHFISGVKLSPFLSIYQVAKQLFMLLLYYAFKYICYLN